MFPFGRKPLDISKVPVIDMKMLIIFHILMIGFIAFIHWRLMVLQDF